MNFLKKITYYNYIKKKRKPNLEPYQQPAAPTNPPLASILHPHHKSQAHLHPSHHIVPHLPFNSLLIISSNNTPLSIIPSIIIIIISSASFAPTNAPKSWKNQDWNSQKLENERCWSKYSYNKTIFHKFSTLLQAHDKLTISLSNAILKSNKRG